MYDRKANARLSYFVAAKGGVSCDTGPLKTKGFAVALFELLCQMATVQTESKTFSQYLGSQFWRIGVGTWPDKALTKDS